MPLTWKTIEEDAEFVCKRAFSGKVRICELRFWFGDGVNSDSKTISSAIVTGRFAKTWFKRGYLWQGEPAYTPACKKGEPEAWVEARWAKFLKDAGLREVA